jgi:hypothetical protein
VAAGNPTGATPGLVVLAGEITHNGLYLLRANHQTYRLPHRIRYRLKGCAVLVAHDSSRPTRKASMKLRRNQPIKALASDQGLDNHMPAMNG